jgi:hypothetical protein
VQRFHWVCTLSADCLWCHFCKEGIRACGFDVTLLGVFLSLPAVYTQGTQHPATGRVESQWEVSQVDIVFRGLWHAKTNLWPLWPYSRPGVCQTFPAVHNHVALPL